MEAQAVAFSTIDLYIRTIAAVQHREHFSSCRVVTPAEHIGDVLQLCHTSLIVPDVVRLNASLGQSWQSRAAHAGHVGMLPHQRAPRLPILLV